MPFVAVMGEFSVDAGVEVLWDTGTVIVVPIVRVTRLETVIVVLGRWYGEPVPIGQGPAVPVLLLEAEG